MNRYAFYVLLPVFLSAFAVSSCSKKAGTAWDGKRSASQMSHGGDSLWVSNGDSPSLEGPMAEDFIPLQEEDLKAQLEDGAFPQPRDIPGDIGSFLPSADAFQTPSGELARIFQNLHFSTDDHILRGEDNLEIVSRMAAYLKAHPNVYIFVEGHCDQRGPQAYNLALGSRRANYVRTLLIEKGVDQNRLHTISFGKEKPLDIRNVAAAWTKNRRAEFKIFVKP